MSSQPAHPHHPSHGGQLHCAAWGEAVAPCSPYYRCQISIEMQPVMRGPVLYSPLSSLWSPGAALTKDIPMLSNDNMSHRHLYIAKDPDMALSSSSGWDLAMAPPSRVDSSTSLHVQAAPLLVLFYLSTTYLYTVVTPAVGWPPRCPTLPPQ